MAYICANFVTISNPKVLIICSAKLILTQAFIFTNISLMSFINSVGLDFQTSILVPSANRTGGDISVIIFVGHLHREGKTKEQVLNLEGHHV
jgi:hypothetical protein